MGNKVADTVSCKVCGKTIKKGGWKGAKCICSESCQTMWEMFGSYAKQYHRTHEAVTRRLKEQMYGLETGSGEKTEAA